MQSIIIVIVQMSTLSLGRMKGLIQEHLTRKEKARVKIHVFQF